MRLGDMTLSTTLLSLSGPDINVNLSGSLHAQVNLLNKTISVSENFVAQDNATRQMIKVENLVVADSYSDIFSRTSFAETINGRVYDSVHGFVDITTTQPFSFANAHQEFPGGGALVLHGANNASALVTALSNTLFTVSLDLDGDGVYEKNATLRWTDIGTAVASDLADNDGDGMHNSWETANSLDPNNASDAGADPDNDGATNLAEYHAGTDPHNATSVP